MTTSRNLLPAFQHNRYLFRRKFFKLFGGAFHIYDESGQLLFYSEQKAFRLREDLRVYADTSRQQELLTIKTPQILDFAATYHVRDATSGEAVGAIRRKGLKSLVRDEWVLLSPEGFELGKMSEVSWGRAILSRMLPLVPQEYTITAREGHEVAHIEQHFNPFVLKYTMTIMEPEPAIDRRLLLATGILLAAIERRQE